MKPKCFVDTNLLIYSVSSDENKRKIAQNIIATDDIVISSQILGEFSFVSIRKKLLEHNEVEKIVQRFQNEFEVFPIMSADVNKALTIMNRYGYSYWDSLVLAVALKSGVEILYSEDMHNNQLIDNQLKIINPFI